jgi:hypothetical protein
MKKLLLITGYPAGSSGRTRGEGRASERLQSW